MPFIREHENTVVLETVQRIADRENVSPTDLPPISTTIDPELLESLPDHATLEFRYHGYLVTVEGSQRITIQQIGGTESPPQRGDGQSA